jgi:hypothetical protein
MGKGKGTHFVGNLLEELFFVELYKVARFLPVSVLQGTNQSGGPLAVSPELLLLLGWNLSGLGLKGHVMILPTIPRETGKSSCTYIPSPSSTCSSCCHKG